MNDLIYTLHLLYQLCHHVNNVEVIILKVFISFLEFIPLDFILPLL
jgi:hypothetical protein